MRKQDYYEPDFDDVPRRSKIPKSRKRKSPAAAASASSSRFCRFFS